MKLQSAITGGALLIAVSCILSFCSSPEQQESYLELYQGFQHPPDEARPRVWWHWMNGNITKDGIRKDLLWMKRSGIGGFQNFDAGLRTPEIVEKRLSYMTPEWKDAFGYATRLADSLGLEMAIAGSPGWSQTGGPWVPAEDGMKKLIWRELRVHGGRPFTGKLPEQYLTTGEFQNIPIAGETTAFNGGEAEPEQYYEDIAVLAYRIPVLTGQIVESTEASERFLWDWRKTISELIAENHYDQLADEGAIICGIKPGLKAGRGAPDRATFEALKSYTEHADPGIRYFSGAAIYTNTFEMPEDAIKTGARFLLDLGAVKNLAEVTVNDQALGVVWKNPFRLDVTNALQSGRNTLKIKVVNLWINRLIGAQQADLEEKITYTTMPFYRADDALRPSGLLGPVSVVSINR